MKPRQCKDDLKKKKERKERKERRREGERRREKERSSLIRYRIGSELEKREWWRLKRSKKYTHKKRDDTELHIRIQCIVH